MKFKQLKQEIKEAQKKVAVNIRILKAARKPRIYQSNPAYYDSLGWVGSHQYDYRHTHIAYCIFFNKTPYEKIERSCYTDYSKGVVEKLHKKWSSLIEEGGDEAVRVSA